MSEPRLADVAIDELEFQREINQQLGEENERLRAENAAMRPVVEAVANTHSRLHCALGCRVNDRWNTEFHAPDCLITQARAFVAAHPTAAGESAGGDDGARADN